MKVKECTGECCRQFPIGGYSLLEIHQWAAKREPLTNILLYPPGSEVPKVLSLLIPIAKFTYFQGKVQPLFTCRHWDQETKRCREYVHRPVMCSTFPYGMKCTICGGDGK